MLLIFPSRDPMGIPYCQTILCGFQKRLPAWPSWLTPAHPRTPQLPLMCTLRTDSLSQPLPRLTLDQQLAPGSGAFQHTSSPNRLGREALEAELHGPSQVLRCTRNATD